jgi:hypothetical protein
MITMWLFRTLLVGVLRGVAALAAERVTGWFGGPRRWVWVSAMLGSIGIPVLALRAPAALPELGIGARWAERLTSPSGSGWQPVGGTVRAVIAVPAPHVLVIAPQKATHLPEAGVAAAAPVVSSDAGSVRSGPRSWSRSWSPARCCATSGGSRH